MKCPNCPAAVPDGSLECPSCGVIFEKLKKLAERELTPPAAPEEKPRDAALTLWRVRMIAGAIVVWWMLALIIWYHVELNKPAP